MDAVSLMTPTHAGERSTILRTQSVTTSSTSLSAGEDCQDRPTVPSPVLTRSPRTPANMRVGGEIAEEAGMLPVRQVRRDDRVEIGDAGLERLRIFRRLGRQHRADLTRPGGRLDRPRCKSRVIVGQPIDKGMAVSAEFFDVHDVTKSIGLNVGPLRTPVGSPRRIEPGWLSRQSVGVAPRRPGSQRAGRRRRNNRKAARADRRSSLGSRSGKTVTSCTTLPI